MMKTNTREEIQGILDLEIYLEFTDWDKVDIEGRDRATDQILALIEKEKKEEMERIISEVREANEFFDYYCDDSECCYGQVQSGIENKLAELEEEE